MITHRAFSSFWFVCVTPPSYAAASAGRFRFESLSLQLQGPAIGFFFPVVLSKHRLAAVSRV